MDELILVVDDAKFARVMAMRALTSGGYTNIIEAASAAEAKQMFVEKHPALTLLDITMSDNCDLTLLIELLAIQPDAKIVMNSAVGQALIIADALEAGAKDFITKPFTDEQLLNIVRSVLDAD